MMLSESAIEAASTALDAGDFYRESHSRIYRAALELYQQGQPVDAITVADKLDERGELDDIGGKERIHELAALVPATSNAGHYAKIVREMATLRGLTAVGEQIQRLGWERPGETPELVDRAEQMVFDLAQHRIRGTFEHVEILVRESFEQITRMYEAGGEMTGTPTGFRDIDQMTSGMQPGNLVVIAGRPSMGKSAFALGIASNLALHHDTPVAVFTLEMSKIEVAQRLMCSEGRVELQRLRTGRLTNEDWPRLVKACDSLTKAPIYVDDTRLTTMLEIRAKARRLKAKEPKLGAIIVDYLQLMSSGTNAENRVQEVSQISRSLKVIAGDLEVPVIALSQLNRAVEGRTDKRPLLSDLRDSGAVEQDADLVMFLYRDEYYNENSEDQGLAEVILAKHRNGPVGTEKLASWRTLRESRRPRAATRPKSDGRRMSRENSASVPPSANQRSRASARRARSAPASDGRSFLEAVRGASVRGHIPRETDVGLFAGEAGHEVVVRRVDRPAPLTRVDGKAATAQMSLARQHVWVGPEATSFEAPCEAVPGPSRRRVVGRGRHAAYHRHAATRRGCRFHDVSAWAPHRRAPRRPHARARRLKK